MQSRWTIRNLERLLGILLLLAVWQTISGFSGNSSLSSPVQVLRDFSHYVPTILASLGPSIFRVTTALFIAVTLGITTGYLLGRSGLAREWLDAPINWLRPVPAVAFIPLLVYWFGLANIGPIIVVALTAIFPIILNTAAGILNIDRRLRETVESLGGTRWDLFWRVDLPGSMPFVITGIRVGATLGWAAIVAAEMFGAQTGIGYQVWVYANYLQMSGVITGVMFIGLMGFTLDNIIRISGRRLTSWTQVTSG